MIRGWLWVALALSGCAASPPPPSSRPPAQTQAPRPEAARPEVEPPLFVGYSLEETAVLGRVAMDQALHMVAPDGTRWVQRVDDVDETGWVGLSERPESVLGVSPWRYQSVESDAVFDDRALGDLYLARVGTPPAAVVSTPFTVHYRDALCESGADEENWSLVEEVTSNGPDPLGPAIDLDPALGHRRRTVTLDLAGQRIHFVFAVEIELTKDRRMASLSRKRREVWLVIREREGRFEVLQRTLSTRGPRMNHDLSCQMPVHDPVPFAARDERDGLAIYTMAPSRVQRWLLSSDGLIPVDTWMMR